ncbi:MBL fold metallo-hydrolase [Halorarius halobius]|uniref:MBL fold metallo-hydrolase n=1 Tax=Halorarius halobius TaxID=2962671 RepID=UPI0020CEB936|nr:MBL fold metallo-hydrolase [Halorarius halobius]
MPRELLGGVYDITCAETEVGRIRAFCFDDGTLIDTGLPDSTDALLDGIEATGVDVERVAITHADRDHVGGLDAVIDAYDPDVYLPVGADPDVAGDVDHYYGDGDTVGTFEAVHVPGHRGHQHALVDEERVVSDASDEETRAGSGATRERRGVAVLADALSGADQRGLPAGHFHLPPGKYTDDLNRAEESLERLLEFEFDAGLVYHGSSVLDRADEKLTRYVL